MTTIGVLQISEEKRLSENEVELITIAYTLCIGKVFIPDMKQSCHDLFRPCYTVRYLIRYYVAKPKIANILDI